MSYHAGQRHLMLLRWSAAGIGAASVLLVTIAAYQAHHMLRQRCNAVDEQQRQDTALIASADKVKADHDQAAQRLQTLKGTLSDLKSRIPNSPNEAEFLAQFSTLAERSLVRLRNFRPGQVTNGDTVSTCEVQLSLVGSFANICRLVDALQESPRYLSITRFALSGPQQASDPCFADMTISIVFSPVQNK